LAAKLGLKGRFNIMYAGNIGLAQGCDKIIEAAEAVLDLNEVQFVFVGFGADSERIEKMARDKNLTNVSFLGRYPQEEMAGLYALADVLVLKLRDDPLFRITIPQKTLSYLACGKPILAAVGGDAADVVMQAEAGLACPPDDAQAIARTVRKFYGMTPDERRQMAVNGRNAAVQQYGKRYLMGKMIEMIEDAVRGKIPQ
jgi:glycosyltransferase involved in cell wall biosynthesis